jgi:effector protein LidA
MKHEVKQHTERKQHYQHLRREFIGQIDEVKASKVQVLQALASSKAQKALLAQSREQTPLEMSPKPKTEQQEESLTPKFSPKLTPSPKPRPCSYTFILHNLERLVPNKGPAPRERDINKVSNLLDQVVPEERKEELHQLIGEVHPGEMMAP